MKFYFGEYKIWNWYTYRALRLVLLYLVPFKISVKYHSTLQKKTELIGKLKIDLP